MDVAGVRDVARRLNEASAHLLNLVGQLDGLVTRVSWEGRDAQHLRGEWWPAHRQQMSAMAESLAGLARSAVNNADAQERTSAGDDRAPVRSAVPSGSVGGPAGGGLTWGAAAAGLGVAATAAGNLARVANDALAPMGHAVAWAGIADSKFLRNPDLPVSRLLTDVMGDGRMKALGSGFTALGIAAGTAETVQFFRDGDYLGGTLEGIDTAAEPFKGKGVHGWLAAGTIQTWTDVVRLEQNMDWDLTNPVYTQGLNPFSAHDRDEVLIPAAKETAIGFIDLVLDDWLP